MENKLNSAKYAIFLLEKLNKETILLNRIIYKTKNQFRRQSTFKLINKLKKILFQTILIEFKTNYVPEIKDGN
jgi:pantothenate kinase-related protein Tda10